MAINRSGHVQLKGSERRPSRGATLLGPSDPHETFSVSIALRRRADGPAKRDFDFYAKTPPSQRRRLSEADFAAAHGASQADIDVVTRFAKAQGLTLEEANAARRTVIVSGTVAQMEKAFAVTLHRYQITRSAGGKKAKPVTETYRGLDGAIHVPRALASVVVGVFGLDNRRITQRGTQDPPGTVHTTVPTVATAYKFPTNSATGQTIAIFSESGYDTTTGPTGDIPKYFATLPAGYTVPTIVAVDVDASNLGPDLETTQDIVIAATVAQGATIAVYFTTYDEKGWWDLLTRVVTPNAGDLPAGVAPASVLSSSFYVCNGDDEDALSAAGISLNWIEAATEAFQDCAVQGVSVCVCSGDNGTDAREGDGIAHVWYPATDPWVLSCGGTTIGPVSSSGTFEEYVWNDDTGATGGGVSYFFPVPSYQQGLPVLTSVNGDGQVGRCVPDVAANSSPNSGYKNIFVGGIAEVGNGTSASAPLNAGLIAVLNAVLGERVGFLNPLLYQLGNTVVRDINPPAGSPTNNGFSGVKGYDAGAGWDACTGWGVINGQALLSALQALESNIAKTLTIVLEKSTFGQDEVTQTGGSFPATLFVIVDGLKPGDFPPYNSVTGITTLSPTATPAQLSAWAPSISGAPSGVTFTPTSVASDDPSLPPGVQRFTFTYQIVVPASVFSTGSFPELATIDATLAVAAAPTPASAQIEFIKEADPFFSSESNGGLWWLSDDLRVFYATQGDTRLGMGAKPLGTTAAEARSFIIDIINNLNAGQGVTSDGQTFEGLPTTEQGSALSLFPTDFNTGKAIFNFAIARVRLTGTAAAEAATKVRVFFRTWQAQSTDITYSTPAAGAGASPAIGPFRQYSDGNTDGRKVPLLGISNDGSEYLTVPYFATARVPPTASMTTQPEDTPNVQSIAPPAGGGTTYAFFGAWLDTNQPDAIFTFGPDPSTDGPFTGTLYPILQMLVRGGHQCLVAEIVDDEAPIVNGANPQGSDKLAQRNLAFTLVANPGVVGSRLATHTFEIRPSPATLDAAGNRPDELMIDWGRVPHGSIGSIYLPAVAAADVLALANQMYATHDLIATDAHTIACPTGGTTYLPIPKGSGANLAGLFSVELPLGIRRGQSFEIVVRQVTNAHVDVDTRQPIGTAGTRRSTGPTAWRRIYGSFQITIPVSTKAEMLLPEERTLSVMRWIEEAIPHTNRWRPVFLRYLEQLAGRVAGLGGDPSKVPPTANGIWPGLGGHGRPPHLPVDHPHHPDHHHHHHHRAFDGKIAGLVYDHFGDFEAFILETKEGERHRFESRETRVLELVRSAWAQRIFTTVMVRHDHPERPLEILLHGAPPVFE
jgi:kumamolisin